MLETRGKGWRWRFLFTACAPDRDEAKMREIVSYAVPELDTDLVCDALQSAIDEQATYSYAISHAIDGVIEEWEEARAAQRESSERGL